MQLTLERCSIRRWRADDAESLAKHANNRKIWLAVRDLFPHPYTIRHAHEFLQRAISELRTRKFVLRLRVPPSAGSVFIRATMCIGTRRQSVTGWASSSGDAE